VVNITWKKVIVFCFNILLQCSVEVVEIVELYNGS
jgi:hypothetical protein